MTTATLTRVASSLTWPEANQACLVSEFERLRRQLDSDTSLHNDSSAVPINPPAAIDQLAEIFGLTDFERDIVLLCAGVEMDSALAEKVAAVQGAPQRTAPTFGLALATLAAPHWSAITPSRPLRHFHLVHSDAANSLTSAPLRIDERILHFLAGINQVDSHLAPMLALVQPPQLIAEDHRAIATEIAEALQTYDATPVMHLCGNDLDGQLDIAALAANEAQRLLFVLGVEEIPADAAAFDQLLLLWTREVALLNASLLVEARNTALSPQAKRFLEKLPGHVLLTSRDSFQLNRPLLRFDANKPRPTEQKRLWQQALGDAAQSYNGLLDNLASQFHLSARAIHVAGSNPHVQSPEALWNACRSRNRTRLEDLAQRIRPAAEWRDLVLPETQMRTLRQLAAQVRSRMKVYETWGFVSRGQRGLGISALFAGESGTGKTLAAEVLAHELALDLYRIDLSSVVSKYIGETEKNLRQVFDAAEEGGALLLFDEADALFGKRSDVKDSHDRYANMEVSYLLQMMEAYQGLTLLTTNLKSSLDHAFQRRLRFLINFPFPDAMQREAIWRHIFPAEAPTDNLNFTALAQLKVPGGSIRNIALNAAFLAADANHLIGMLHILEAAKSELAKIDRPLSESEVRGWL